MVCCLLLRSERRVSFVVATPEALAAAGQDVSEIGAAVRAAHAAAAAPTTCSVITFPYFLFGNNKKIIGRMTVLRQITRILNP
jgi:hypothetical protein